MKNRIDELYGFYKGKTVLVTGHTGFKGSWLSYWLELMGANVIGYSLKNKKNNNLNINRSINNGIIDLRGDIRNRSKVKGVFDLYNPDIVFHLAAQPLVGDSYSNPHYTLETNIMGTINVLDAFQNCSACKVAIVITTDKVYKNNESQLGYIETDMLGGYDPYSASKASVELIVESWRDSFLAPDNFSKALATVRAGNVIGGGDWAKNRLIPDIIRSIEAGKPIIVRNPESIRPWQYVLEPLYGYLILGKSMFYESHEYSGAWNFGPTMESQRKVVDLVNLFSRLFDFDQIKIYKPKLFHETKLLTLNSTKSKLRLNWINVLNFDETIYFTAYWYRNYKMLDLNKLMTLQIREFEQHLIEEKI